MSTTFNSSEGHPVIAADTAETIGEVKGFIIDRQATRVEGVHISGRGKRAEIVPWSAISSFGADAMVAEMAASTEQVSSEHETEAVKGKIVARDARVLDTNGFECGTVKDVMFDPETGKLTGVLTTEGHLDSAELRSLGSYALVVAAR